MISFLSFSSCENKKKNFSNKNTDVSSHKTIRWSDGKDYSYDNVEEFEIIEHNKPSRYTVYSMNKPDEDDFNCKVRKCKWCAAEIYSESIELNEYPNIGWVRGERSIESLFGVLNVGNSDAAAFYDLPNHKIRTE